MIRAFETSKQAHQRHSDKAARTRDRILTLAAQAASVNGIGTLTIGGLASATGMSKSGLYVHFGSKEALQIALVDTIEKQFRKEVVGPVFAMPSGKDQLLEMMRLWIAWSQSPDRPGGCQLIAATFELDGLDGSVRDRLAKSIDAWRGAIRVLWNNGKPKGELRGLDAEQAASLAYGLYAAQHIERFLLHDQTAPERAMKLWKAAACR
ncbi:TetR/AcrR family transcriptional regulator [Aestuariibius sp. 2305UL40-4]|uniref:TetR/AcrR family transcriptional regulator n=1 Tax=Aestuariibius violaceus TaxID=3234132 RepID=UPI00345E83B2